MATNLSSVPFPATAVRPSHHRTSLRTAASPWWTPILGLSSEPDYIDSDAKARFAPGCFTAEKAKRLRMMTKETETFHDVMYHSAIASRLALDSKNHLRRE